MSKRPDAKPLSAMYRTVHADRFPQQIEMTWSAPDGKKSVIIYEKITWQLPAGRYGLRYGENPEQGAALYRLRTGNVAIAGLEYLHTNNKTIAASELLRAGKHPSKTNIFDIDSALQLMRFYADSPTAVIVKHNNPCTVAQSDTLASALQRAYNADLISSFGGVVVLNRSVDVATAEILCAYFFEVVAAPEFEEAALDLIYQKKNTRIFKIPAIDNLQSNDAQRFIEFRTLSDMSLCLQESFTSQLRTPEDFHTAQAEYRGHNYRSQYSPSHSQLQDLLFGWHIVESLWSNAVVFVNDLCTVGVSGGTSSRVDAVQNAIHKSYACAREREAQSLYDISYMEISDSEQKANIEQRILNDRGGMQGSVLCSDAFFPFADGVQPAITEQVTAIAEPGGALRDWQIIETCNTHAVPLLFTQQRAFRH